MLPRGQAPDGSLRIGGLVVSSRTLSYAEVDALPKVFMNEDLRCSTGRVTSDLEWEGVSVSRILQCVEILDNARYVLFGCGDYTAVLDMALAMRENTVLALKRSGKTMTVESGGPLRLVFEGGMAYESVKSVDHIELLAEDVEGTARCASTLSSKDA